MIYTKEQAYAEITKLVDTFRTSETRLNTEAEAQIENNFIRPLFKYLNWNTENDALDILDYEFVVQRTNRYGKRPDYILQLDGQHLLVMDAKQVKLDMHDPRWMNQVYAYAYSTQNLSPSRKIDFAILTDFQEFVVLDCTLYAGDPKAVANFRIMELDWRYDDYVTQFDTLWGLFERENMRQAARTRGTDAPAGLWARALSPKKVKANRIPPDKAFLMEMDDDKTGWRVRLAKDMKKHNPEADGALITAAVQLLIDRLIFVKALSDREIEDDYLSQLAQKVEQDGLAESDIGWFTACRAIFTKLNEFYNGSIFESRPELEAVTVSNKVVRAIIHDLQPENSSYNFAIMPVEILGTIYERFLGRVVRTTDKQVKIEDKPEVRKAGGVYYTPQYIVKYIVQNTVGKLLEKCRTPEDVAKLKILDPACGSGSFLVGAYNTLVEWHIRYYSDKARLTKRDRAAVYQDSDGRIRLTAKLKRQILLNNLYGVDIDPQAVEVTRFSLSLKALEDIRQGEVYEERNLFNQTVLPDLSQNIKCGNSLIGPDYFAGQMLIDPAELKRVNPFDWAHEFLDVVKSGGFDVVIGNPPYVRSINLKESSPVLWNLYRSQYSTASSKEWDIYLIFTEKGLGLLNPSGKLGFILPNKFLNSQVGENLRSIISEGHHLERLIHFGAFQIFPGVTTYTCLLFLSHRGNEEAKVARFTSAVKKSGMLCFLPEEAPDLWQISQIPAIRFTADVWKFSASGGTLLNKLKQYPRLESVAQVFQGTGTRADKVYLVEPRGQKGELVSVYSHETDEEYLLEPIFLRPVLRGRSIKRYGIEEQKLLLIVPYEIINGKSVLVSESKLASLAPKTLEYLRKCKPRLDEREKGRFKGQPGWYAYGYPRSMTKFESLKIVMPDVCNRGQCWIENQPYWLIDTAYGLVTPDNKIGLMYLLGILNSPLLTYFLKETGTALRGGYFRMKTAYLNPFPIRTINFSDTADKARYDKMVKLVESMLALHKHKAVAKTQADQELYQRQIDAIDREIDALVYELYGLTPDEIATVEAVK